MTESRDQVAGRSDTSAGKNWGAWLFYCTLVAILVFFWWLLIESGGVSGHHG